MRGRPSALTREENKGTNNKRKRRKNTWHKHKAQAPSTKHRRKNPPSLTPPTNPLQTLTPDFAGLVDDKPPELVGPAQQAPDKSPMHNIGALGARVRVPDREQRVDGAAAVHGLVRGVRVGIVVDVGVSRSVCGQRGISDKARGRVDKSTRFFWVVWGLRRDDDVRAARRQVGCYGRDVVVVCVDGSVDTSGKAATSAIPPFAYGPFLLPGKKKCLEQVLFWPLVFSFPIQKKKKGHTMDGNECGEMQRNVLVDKVADFVAGPDAVARAIVGTRGCIVVAKLDDYPIARLNGFGNVCEQIPGGVASRRSAGYGIILDLQRRKRVFQVFSPAWNPSIRSVCKAAIGGYGGEEKEDLGGGGRKEKKKMERRI